MFHEFLAWYWTASLNFHSLLITNSTVSQNLFFGIKLLFALSISIVYKTKLNVHIGWYCSHFKISNAISPKSLQPGLYYLHIPSALTLTARAKWPICFCIAIDHRVCLCEVVFVGVICITIDGMWALKLTYSPLGYCWFTYCSWHVILWICHW